MTSKSTLNERQTLVSAIKQLGIADFLCRRHFVNALKAIEIAIGNTEDQKLSRAMSDLVQTVEAGNSDEECARLFSEFKSESDLPSVMNRKVDEMVSL